MIVYFQYLFIVRPTYYETSNILYMVLHGFVKSRQHLI